MTEQQIVYFDDSDASFLEEEHGLTVVEVFDFGEDCACLVESDINLAELYNLDTRIFDVDANFSFETHDINVTDADELADFSDVRSLHIAEENLDGQEQTIAITDSGVDTEHPMFDGVEIKKVNLTDSSQTDSVGHGTAVAGQVVQFAPNASLVMLRIFGERGRTSLRTVLRAYEWVINNADTVDILNMSIGSSQTSRRLNSIHNRVERSGVTTVVSAGNSGGPSGSPATASQAYSVGACDQNGDMARFSSYNPDGPMNPEVTAVGKNNKLAKSRNGSMGEVIDRNYIKASGTSFSSPEVAGMIASLRSHGIENPRKVLSEFAGQVENTNRDGNGLVKYGPAVNSNNNGGPEIFEKEADVWEFAGGDVFYVKGDNIESGEYVAEITTNNEGERVFEFKPA